MEHASIASFSRFTMQLLSLGAPVELVAASQRAGSDELDHARLAYGLASAYAGHDVGPGPLDISGALDGGVEGFVETLVLEGCIGETVAAATAMRSRDAVSDPAVRAVFGRIATDETRHATLAWRTLRWFADREGDWVWTRAARLVAHELEPRQPEATAEIGQDGVLSRACEARIRHDVLHGIVAPTLAQLRRSSPHLIQGGDESHSCPRRPSMVAT